MVENFDARGSQFDYLVANKVANEIFRAGGVWSLVKADLNY